MLVSYINYHGFLDSLECDMKDLLEDDMIIKVFGVPFMGDKSFDKSIKYYNEHKREQRFRFFELKDGAYILVDIKEIEEELIDRWYKLYNDYLDISY